MTLIHLAKICPEFMLDDLLQTKTSGNYTILNQAVQNNPFALLSIMDILRHPKRHVTRTMLLWSRNYKNKLFLHDLVIEDDDRAPILASILSELSPHEKSWAIVSLLPTVGIKPKMLAIVLEAYPECDRFDRLIEHKVLYRRMWVSFEIFEVILNLLPPPEDSTDAKEALNIMFGDSRHLLASFMQQLPEGFCKARFVEASLYKLDANLLKRRGDLNLPRLVSKPIALKEEEKDEQNRPPTQAISFSEPLSVNARGAFTLKWFSSIAAIIDPRLLGLILAGFSATVIARFSRHRFFAEAPLNFIDDESCNPENPFYFS